MNYKNIFERFEKENVFIRETLPGSVVETTQKAALNRKGNILFNAGNVEAARRIFITTGYTDGLCRVGDYYKSQSRLIDALRMYWIAPDRTKAAPVIEHLSGFIKFLLHEEEEPINDRD